jgi:hypothetical protein
MDASSLRNSENFLWDWAGEARLALLHTEWLQDAEQRSRRARRQPGLRPSLRATDCGEWWSTSDSASAHRCSGLRRRQSGWRARCRRRRGLARDCQQPDIEWPPEDELRPPYRPGRVASRHAPETGLRSGSTLTTEGIPRSHGSRRRSQTIESYSGGAAAPLTRSRAGARAPIKAGDGRKSLSPAGP